MLIFLLGKPDHWSVSIQALINETSNATRKSGRDVVYSLLDELITAGYVQRVQISEAGKFGAVDYLVSERRNTPLTENTEADSLPYTDLPLTGLPYTEKPPLVSIDIKQVLNPSNNTSAKPKKQKIANPSFNFETATFADLPQERVAQWADAYPAVNINAEIKKAALWLVTNPKNRKSDYLRFLNGWLSRAQDRAPASNVKRPTPTYQSVHITRAQTAHDMLGMFNTAPMESNNERIVYDVPAG
jgi:hypothetical protein